MNSEKIRSSCFDGGFLSFFFLARSFKATATPVPKVASFRTVNFRPKFTFLKPTSAGNFMPQNNPLSIRAQKVEIAKAYEKGGAACLSVLTDEKYSQGGFKNLGTVRNSGVKKGNWIDLFYAEA